MHRPEQEKYSQSINFYLLDNARAARKHEHVDTLFEHTMSSLQFVINNDLPVHFDPARLVIAGWAGRNVEEVERHIAELAAIGVKRPSTVPCFYELSPALLTSRETIDVVGDHSSGEVEAVLLLHPEHGMLVGIGSDHTDRKAEGYDVAISKQVCAKPMGPRLWRYDDVVPHWDQLVARSWLIDDQARRTLYQEGPLSRLLHAEQLLDDVSAASAIAPYTVIFCGTQALLGPLEPAHLFEIELHDPVLLRTLAHRYRVNALLHVE
jgi:hypothetical protein